MRDVMSDVDRGVSDSRFDPVPVREQALQASESARTRGAEKRRSRRVLTFQVFLLGLILTVWSLVSGRLVDGLFLSDPLSVAEAFWAMLRDGTLWFHLRFTLTEMILGYIVGATLGLLAAAVVSSLPWGEPIIRPFALAGFATPKVALAPVIIVWFGIGLLPKIVLAASLVFFIVYFNTLAGIRSVSPELISVARVMSASRAAMLTKIVLPNAMPFIITALRITVPAALIGAIIGELMSSNRGVGYLISAASTRYDTADVFAGIFGLLVFVLLLNSLLSTLELRLLRWRPYRGGASNRE